MSKILEVAGVKYIPHYCEYEEYSHCIGCALIDDGCPVDNGLDNRCIDSFVWIKAKGEVFTDDQVVIAIERFLEYGEETFCLDNDKIINGHGGVLIMTKL